MMINGSEYSCLTDRFRTFVSSLAHQKQLVVFLYGWSLSIKGTLSWKVHQLAISKSGEIYAFYFTAAFMDRPLDVNSGSDLARTMVPWLSVVCI